MFLVVRKEHVNVTQLQVTTINISHITSTNITVSHFIAGYGGAQQYLEPLGSNPPRNTNKRTKRKVYDNEYAHKVHSLCYQLHSRRLVCSCTEIWGQLKAVTYTTFTCLSYRIWSIHAKYQVNHIF